MDRTCRWKWQFKEASWEAVSGGQVCLLLTLDWTWRWGITMIWRWVIWWMTSRPTCRKKKCTRCSKRHSGWTDPLINSIIHIQNHGLCWSCVLPPDESKVEGVVFGLISAFSKSSYAILITVPSYLLFEVAACSRASKWGQVLPAPSSAPYSSSELTLTSRSALSLFSSSILFIIS